MKFDQIKTRLKNCNVGIAGCGGLGSNCAVILARTGIGGLILVDYDTVERSNLNRQYYFLNQLGRKKVEALKENIESIDPTVRVKTIFTKLTPSNCAEIFRDSDLVVEALDKAEEKAWLIQALMGKKPEMRVVSGSGIAGFGSNNRIKTRRYGNLWVCGDGETEVSDENPALAPKVSIVAGMEANQAVEILLKKIHENEDKTE
ncbi:sulfur carrier protein ThiS adenylyltransferase ThiF [candidate division WOR-3 bacterium]|nr:sulfur carrier protein ThiS adenylyltransferase ThiF [candidate division WOR-3 bacterium]